MIGHEAVPVASVVAVHVSVLFSVRVTDSLAIGALVLASVSTADTEVVSE